MLLKRQETICSLECIILLFCRLFSKYSLEMFGYVTRVKEGKELHSDSGLGLNLSSVTDFFFSFINLYVWQKIEYYW